MTMSSYLLGGGRKGQGGIGEGSLWPPAGGAGHDVARAPLHINGDNACEATAASQVAVASSCLSASACTLQAPTAATPTPVTTTHAPLLAPLPALPHHAAVVQLVHHHNQLHHAQGLGQLRVFARLQAERGGGEESSSGGGDAAKAPQAAARAWCASLATAHEAPRRPLRRHMPPAAPARPSQSRSRTRPCGC